MRALWALKEMDGSLFGYATGSAALWIFRIVSVHPAAHRSDVIDVLVESGTMLVELIPCTAKGFPIDCVEGGLVPLEVLAQVLALVALYTN